MQSIRPIATSLESAPDNDSELVLAAQKDPALFRSIYDRWAVPIYQYFYHRTGEISSAEDLASQLFLSVYQSLPRYHHHGHFPAWLFTVARNLLKEYYRKNQREVPLEMAQQMIANSDPPAEHALVDEIEQLRKLIQSLSEEDQELIRLRYVAELTFADMAIVLHKREDAVKKSLYRLQARLQILLEQNHD